VKHSEPDSGDNAHSITSTSFVFGENLADRAKVCGSSASMFVTGSGGVFRREEVLAICTFLSRFFLYRWLMICASWPFLLLNVFNAVQDRIFFSL